MIEAKDKNSLVDALKEAKQMDRTTVIVVETDREQRVGGYESWWEVAVAEVSIDDQVRKARKKYEEELKRERYFL